MQSDLLSLPLDSLPSMCLILIQHRTQAFGFRLLDSITILSVNCKINLSIDLAGRCLQRHYKEVPNIPRLFAFLFLLMLTHIFPGWFSSDKPWLPKGKHGNQNVSIMQGKISLEFGARVMLISESTKLLLTSNSLSLIALF